MAGSSGDESGLGPENRTPSRGTRSSIQVLVPATWVRCPAFGLDEGRGKVASSSLPHPSMAEGRIPSRGTGKRAHWVYILHTPCAGFLKTSAWYRVPGPGYLAPGTRDRINAEGRIPSTEDRARPPENAHPGFASCILHPVSCIPHPLPCRCRRLSIGSDGRGSSSWPDCCPMGSPVVRRDRPFHPCPRSHRHPRSGGSGASAPNAASGWSRRTGT
jgi:hypothetical protein